MPKTKFQSVVFTAITAWIMVYFMTLYNSVIASGEFSNLTFLAALKNMWIEYIIIGLCAYFISTPLAKHLAFKVINSNGRQIFIILTIQVFTVICQVAFASIIGVYHASGFNSQIIPNYLRAYCLNFAMAMPLQIFVAGPAARFIFRKIYPNNN